MQLSIRMAEKSADSLTSFKINKRPLSSYLLMSKQATTVLCIGLDDQIDYLELLFLQKI